MNQKSNKMTIERLEKYTSIKRQIEIFRSDLGISYICGVNTTKPSVQSGKKSTPAEDMALRLYDIDKECYSEYKHLISELEDMTKYILHIKNEQIKEIAIRKFMLGQTYEQIGKAMFFDRTTAMRKLRNYIAHNAH